MPPVQDSPRTPALAVLARRAEELFALEQQRFEDAHASLMGRRSVARAEMAALAEAAEELDKRLANIPERLSEDELAARVGGEHNTPGEIVRDRRRRAHQRLRAAVAAELAETTAAYRRAATTATLADEEITHLLDLTEARIQRIHAHFQQRAGEYWRWLVRAHPDGEQLLSRLDLLVPGLPAWLGAAQRDWRHAHERT